MTKLLQDDEIVVFGAVDAQPGWDDSGTMQLDKLDNASDGSMNLVYNWDWEKGPYDPTYDIVWPAVTTADLDADGKDEVVGAAKFQDLNGTLVTLGFMNPEVSNRADLEVHGLQGWNSQMQGAELNHFDIAAGNLKRTANGAEQAVVAFRASTGGLHVLLAEKHPGGAGSTFSASGGARSMPRATWGMSPWTPATWMAMATMTRSSWPLSMATGISRWWSWSGTGARASIA